MPRKSTSSIAPTAGQVDGTGDNSVLSHTPSIASPVRQTTVAKTESESPSRTKVQTPVSKGGGDKSARKSVGNANPEDGGVEKAVKGGKAKSDDMTIDVSTNYLDGSRASSFAMKNPSPCVD
jgi:hypothetical protein